MTLEIKHDFVSAVPDEGDPNKVGSDEWNAAHDITMAGERLLGKADAGAGAATELTAAQVRSLINVEDGATADQSAAELLTAIKTVDGAGSGLDADLLDGLSSAAFATAAQGVLADAALPAASYTAADVLTKIKTVDGAGSGLDADLLDGNEAAAFALASHTHPVADLSDATANGRSLISAADYAAMRALLDLEAGTDFLAPAAIAAAYQPLDGDLTALAAAGNSAVLAATTASFLTADETKLDGIEALADVTDATNVAAAGAAMLATADQTVTGGARVTTNDLGNLSGNTITPDPGDRPIQKITNNGAGTIAPGTNQGCYLLVVKNTTGAGAITTSGWTDVDGDAFTTATTAEFLCHCTVVGDFSSMTVKQVTA